ncbi:hypothetical protein [Burkholderia pseudomultivorans]|uniref:hypothetical protein n=1 Tax=Burkholderia pseudomultivorans TaxID=1207504 RepID=UPI002ED86097
MPPVCLRAANHPVAEIESGFGIRRKERRGTTAARPAAARDDVVVQHRARPAGRCVVTGTRLSQRIGRHDYLDQISRCIGLDFRLRLKRSIVVAIPVKQLRRRSFRCSDARRVVGNGSLPVAAVRLGGVDSRCGGARHRRFGKQRALAAQKCQQTPLATRCQFVRQVQTRTCDQRAIKADVTVIVEADVGHSARLTVDGERDAMHAIDEARLFRKVPCECRVETALLQRLDVEIDARTRCRRYLLR